MKNVKNLSDASLWIDTDNGFYKLTDCEALIEVSEELQTLKLPGSETEYAVKSYSAALAICTGVKPGIDVELLRTVRKFCLKFEPLEVKSKQCKIFINEFDNIIPIEIDLNGEWRFDITEQLKNIKWLFPDLAFSEG